MGTQDPGAQHWNYQGRVFDRIAIYRVQHAAIAPFPWIAGSLNERSDAKSRKVRD
jgi:hypothetical protein